MSVTTLISVALLGKKKKTRANLLIGEMDRMKYIECVMASVGCLQG